MISTCKWMGTLLCAAGIFLTSVNVFPLNIILGGVGSLAWVIASLATRDTPLFTIEFYSVVMYAFGLASWVTVPDTKMNRCTAEDPKYKIEQVVPASKPTITYLTREEWPSG